MSLFPKALASLIQNLYNVYSQDQIGLSRIKGSDDGFRMSNSVSIAKKNFKQKRAKMMYIFFVKPNSRWLIRDLEST